MTVEDETAVSLHLERYDLHSMKDFYQIIEREESFFLFL